MPASPNGWSTTDASHPTSAYVGKPVGWNVPRTGGDGLGLAGVPVAEPGHERPPDEHERHDRATATRR